MTSDNFKQLTKSQLEERWEAAIGREQKAQEAFTTKVPNLSQNRSGRVPEIPMSELQELDDELQSAQAEREAIEEEMRNR